MTNLFTCFCCCLFCFFSIQKTAAQNYLYSDHEIKVNPLKEDTKVIMDSAGFFHVWRWGSGGVKMDLFDTQLHYISTKKLSGNVASIAFLPLKDRYYALITEAKYIKVFSVKEGGECTEKVNEFAKLIDEWGPIDRIQEGDNKLFFVKFNDTDSVGQSQMYVIAADKELHYLNTLEQRINYPRASLGTLKYFHEGDKLIMINTISGEDSTRMMVHSIDVDQARIYAGSFGFEGRLYSAEKLIPYKNGDLLIQGRAAGPEKTVMHQMDYTCLLLLDSTLHEAKNRFYASLHDSIVPGHSVTYYPVSTVVLPDKDILSIEYARRQQGVLGKTSTKLRFMRLNPDLRMVDSVYQDATSYNNTSSNSYTSWKSPSRFSSMSNYATSVSPGPSIYNSIPGSLSAVSQVNNGMIIPGSAGSTVTSAYNASSGFLNVPAYLFPQDKDILVYYEEEVRRGVFSIHSYEPIGATDSDKVLQLQPGNRYQLANAIRVNQDCFVMPYFRNMNFGLVKVKAGSE